MRKTQKMGKEIRRTRGLVGSTVRDSVIARRAMPDVAIYWRR